MCHCVFVYMGLACGFLHLWVQYFTEGCTNISLSYFTVSTCNCACKVCDVDLEQSDTSCYFLREGSRVLQFVLLPLPRRLCFHSCLFVCFPTGFTQKILNRFLLILVDGTGQGPRKRPFKFEADLTFFFLSLKSGASCLTPALVEEHYVFSEWPSSHRLKLFMLHLVQNVFIIIDTT